MVSRDFRHEANRADGQHEDRAYGQGSTKDQDLDDTLNLKTLVSFKQDVDYSNRNENSIQSMNSYDKYVVMVRVIP